MQTASADSVFSVTSNPTRRMHLPKLLQALLLAIVPFMMMGALVAQTPPTPPTPPVPVTPTPTGVVNQVEVRGTVLEDWGHEFFEDGTWEMWKANGELVGWGTWEQDPATGEIHYLNESGDGGGNQTGTYEWDSSSAAWDRTAASHPDAPKLRLLPPL